MSALYLPGCYFSVSMLFSVCILICISVCVSARMYLSICPYVCVYGCPSVCLCVCVCLFAHFPFPVCDTLSFPAHLVTGHLSLARHLGICDVNTLPGVCHFLEAGRLQDPYRRRHAGCHSTQVYIGSAFGFFPRSVRGSNGRRGAHRAHPEGTNYDSTSIAYTIPGHIIRTNTIFGT